MNYTNRKRAYYQDNFCMDNFICKRCGHLSSNEVAADDNLVKLISIALKPLAQPPFPLEKITEKIEKEDEK